MLSQLQGHQNWACIYVMEAKNGHFLVFSSSWKIDWSNFFSHAHQKNIMIFNHNLWKFHQNPKIFYYIKFCDAFAKVESENFHNFINKKLVVSIFVTNRFERY